MLILVVTLFLLLFLAQSVSAGECLPSSSPAWFNPFKRLMSAEGLCLTLAVEGGSLVSIWLPCCETNRAIIEIMAQKYCLIKFLGTLQVLV